VTTSLVAERPAAVAAQPRIVVLQIEHHTHTGEVQTGVDEVADAAQPVKVIGTVATGTTRRAIRFDQPA
jgi:hypothetical protein